MTIAAAAADGRLANLDAVLRAAESAGPAGRTVDLQPMGGIQLRLLADRGLDVGPAWFGGSPLAWVSAVAEVPPLQPQTLAGRMWDEAFGGGLVTTCGLRNVGAASEGHGLHGTYSHLPAREVRVGRVVDDAGARVRAAAVVDDAGALTHHLRLSRTVETWAGEGRVELTDVVANLGREPEPAPILYHCNFGYPLWDRGARLEIDAAATHARDGDARAALDAWREPPAVEAAPERVLEHDVAGDWGEARVANPALGVAVTVRWRRAELPRLHQWVNPSPGIYVLGIEPANASVMGRAHDRAEDRLPVLAPGQERETRLTIIAERTS